VRCARRSPAHLTAHPGAAFTAHEIAKVIGHSAEAARRALTVRTDRRPGAGHHAARTLQQS
jgi:hypothetical protein